MLSIVSNASEGKRYEAKMHAHDTHRAATSRRARERFISIVPSIQHVTAQANNGLVRDIQAKRYPGDEPEAVTAARSPDSEVLRAVLAHAVKDFDPTLSGNETPGWQERCRCEANAEAFDSRSGWWLTTPLLEAIRSRLPENVGLLLQAGADPNGVAIEILSEYAARWLRHIPYPNDGLGWASVEEALATTQVGQNASLTADEIASRTDSIYYGPIMPSIDPLDTERVPTFVQFFAPPYVQLNGANNKTAALPTLALVDAARIGSCALVEDLIKSGADTSFWRDPSSDLPSQPTHTHLSISTPIHAAIYSLNPEMLKCLLRHGLSPNTRPLIDPLRSIPPLIACLFTNPCFLEGYKILLQNGADISLRTRVLDVHILHIATATLRVDLLRRLTQDVPLKAAGTTALGHTLVHVSCLPLDQTHVCIFALKVLASIREVRTLTRDWRPNIVDMTLEVVITTDPPEFRQDTEWNEAQMEMLQYLLSNDIADVAAQDVHGNTALHYLAGYRRHPYPALTLLRDAPQGERTWTTARNNWGHTPQDLYEDVQAAAVTAKRLALERNAPHMFQTTVEVPGYESIRNKIPPAFLPPLGTPLPMGYEEKRRAAGPPPGFPPPLDVHEGWVCI